ncbi:hypothetical protein N7481_003795 [Penicillium waksmanii]|uniref:uncharacterized protein n=1 Tax=Penicillium waksmanii TaxID=69791 RepID=UPI002546E339|nr:uncharacterized protein N7481_003795 [Penicillium waksmanii]KAJ5988585.1 hypothetical protein N7481_003795 [Penicillium waksmanii]
MEAVHTFDPHLSGPFSQPNWSATDGNTHAACTVCLRFLTVPLGSQETRQSYSLEELKFRSKVNRIITSPSDYPNNPSTPTAKVPFADATKMAPGKAPAQSRKEKRNLVRWDTDIDTHLLLAIQAACNSSNTKIPWDLVASTMGPKYTEGAIVQHLSKLRSRRVRDGKIVPPPLRRAAAGSHKGGSKGSVQQSGVVDALSKEEVDDLSSGGSDPEYGAPTPRKQKRPLTRRASSSASAKKRTKLCGRKISPKEEKACVYAPFLQFLPAKSENPTDAPSDAPESSSEELDDTLSSEKEEMTGLNRFASPAIADIQKSEIFEEKSPSPVARQKLRVSFKSRTASMLSSEAVDEHSSTPASMGRNSPKTPRLQANIDRFWSPEALQMTGDSSQGGTPSRVQEFMRSPSQYPMQPNPLLLQPLNHKPATFQGALQSPDFFDPKTYVQRAAFQENPSSRYAQYPTQPQSWRYAARGQQYPLSPVNSQKPPFSPGGFFYLPENHRSLEMEINMPSPGYGLPPSSPNANVINPQDLLINAGNISSRGFEELVGYEDDPGAGSF